MKKQILFVDDEQHVLDALRRMLRSQSDIWQMTFVNSAEAAWERLLEEEFDVMVCDVRMPGTSGLSLLRRIRQTEQTKELPVVMLTALQDRRLKRRALNLGAVDLLSQPVEQEDLVARISSLLKLKSYQDKIKAHGELLERRVRERTRELTEQAEQLEVARSMAEAASRAKSEFLTNVSHEIRTPMTAILGFAEILSDNLEDPENIEAVRTIQRNGELLLEIISNILILSQMECGKLDVEQVPCSPRQIVADVVSLMTVRAEAKGLPLTADYVQPIPEEIATDPVRLREILTNLIGNAIKFTEVGCVRVTTRSVENADGQPGLRIDVTDTGIGITEEQSSRLFKPFSQSDTSATRRFGGSGLGLAISKRLAGMLQGDITVTSIPGEGSTFSLTIPAGSLAGVVQLSP